MAHYIQATDITDKLVKAFIDAGDTRLETWYTAVDNEVKGLAYDSGVQESQITLPLHPRIAEYAVNYFCKRVMFDSILINNPDSPELDKYKAKYEIYKSECERLIGRITAGMFYLTDPSISQINRVSSGMLVRG